MINDGKIVALKREINALRKQRLGVLSPEQSQIITDRINEIKDEIADLNKPTRHIVPIVNAPVVAEHKYIPKTSVKGNRVMI